MDGKRVRRYAGDFFAVLFLVTIVYVLVRPQSKGVETIDLFTNGMVAMVRAATDI